MCTSGELPGEETSGWMGASSVCVVEVGGD